MSETPFADFLANNNISAGWEYKYPTLVDRAKELYRSTKITFWISFSICISSLAALLFIPYGGYMFFVSAVALLWAYLTQSTWHTYRKARKLYWRLKSEIIIPYKQRNV